MRGLGLPDEAGTGVGPFLRAIQEQADREAANPSDSAADDRMETD